ncbi:hypothetical protein EJ04DRAFT_580407 [Polyplosphaeria fusca]|uniref:Uncharacterized protein n=1 Tax=Polyplosphaeria fusca TaxID=682080 RepID=A0A9P4QQS8_9PLEO|nr:hypothetical protein EJ04DRAFT_580407 [Polyplosphaeria fusca]
MAEHLSQKDEVHLKKRYGISPKKLRIPGTFTRANPSYLLADIAWIAIDVVAALVNAGTILARHRSSFTVVIEGDSDTVDFSGLGADALNKYLTEHPDYVQRALDLGNKRLHYLARLVDPLPAFISKPSRSVAVIAALTSLYVLIRFWILHRKWRFNTPIMLLSYMVWSGAFMWTPLDADLSMWTALYMAFPFISACSVLLHNFLGKNAWKPTTLVLRALDNPRGQDDENEAFLEEYEMNKRAAA